MKIVNLKTFRELPPNTVFAKYEPCVFNELQIKGDTWECDFLVTSNLADAIKCSGSGEFGELLDRAEKDGISLEMDFDTEGRDGCFEDDQLFAVWEKADVRALIERLKLCLPNESSSATGGGQGVTNATKP
jgi:hypothetical protein